MRAFSTFQDVVDFGFFLTTPSFSTLIGIPPIINSPGYFLANLISSRLESLTVSSITLLFDIFSIVLTRLMKSPLDMYPINFVLPRPLP
ncbi:MAG: hypothetical protein ACTSRU_16510 [Candidatus Hodarchaeales archaeon]